MFTHQAPQPTGLFHAGLIAKPLAPITGPVRIELVQEILNPVSQEQRQEILERMCAARVPAASICAALFINRLELKALARERGLILNTAPVGAIITGRPWTVVEIARLSRAWLTGVRIADIARSLGRTSYSIRKKRAALALPPRIDARWSEDEIARLTADRSNGHTTIAIARRLGRTLSSIRARLRRQSAHRAAAALAGIPSDPAIVLTWQQAQTLSPKERRNRRWQVRNSVTGLVVGFKAKNNHLIWTTEARDEIAQRHFAGQTSEAIAEDFLLTRGAIVSQAWWLSLPRRSKKDLRDDFVPELATVNEARMGYCRRECLSGSGFVFWSKKGGNGERFSRYAKKDWDKQ